MEVSWDILKQIIRSHFTSSTVTVRGKTIPEGRLTVNNSNGLLELRYSYRAPGTDSSYTQCIQDQNLIKRVIETKEVLEAMLPTLRTKINYFHSETQKLTELCESVEEENKITEV